MSDDVFYPIVGIYENHFEINKLGIVRSVKRSYLNKLGVKRNNKGKILKPFSGNSGYLLIQFSMEGNHSSVLLHRLLAVNFIHNPYSYPCVNHIDGNKLNNSLSNLEWCTYSQNNQHKYDVGHVSKLRKLDEDVVKDIYLNAKIGIRGNINDNKSNIKLFQEKYSIDRVVIHKIVKGITYKNITNNINRKKWKTKI